MGVYFTLICNAGVLVTQVSTLGTIYFAIKRQLQWSPKRAMRIELGHLSHLPGFEPNTILRQGPLETHPLPQSILRLRTLGNR